VTSIAQKEIYDLISYTPPTSWKKQTTETLVTYTISNNSTKSWCRISIMKSTTSKGDIDQDFESERQNLIEKNYPSTDSMQLNPTQELNGYKIKSGSSPFLFENKPAVALLNTASGFGRCTSIVIFTNSQEYIENIESFLSSVDLSKPVVQETNQETNSTNTNGNSPSSILGTWSKSSSNNSSYEMANGLHGYIIDQYIFNKDGTYSFIMRNFSYLPDILFAKESGTYKLSGKTITVIPQKSVIEKWTKGYTTEADGRKVYHDKLGKLISSQKRTLEKTTYSYTWEYFSGIDQWNLMLSTDKPTQRDGPFNGGSNFNNTYLYKSVTSDAFRVKTD
jgi:hypothetical protein